MAMILVTGAGGVLGSAIVKRFQRDGEAFFAVGGRLDCDLERFDEVIKLFERVRPTQVVHLAGSVYGVGGNLAYPGDIYRKNILINTNVIEAARLTNVSKFLGMGTIAMYSDGLNMPIKETDVLVGQPHSSERFYAYAKRGMLMQLEAYKMQYGMDFAVTLSTNLYGVNDRFDEEHGHVVPSLISKFVRSSSNGESFSVWGDGSPTRDFLYSDDAAEGTLCVLKRGSGVYNLASGKSISIRELVSVLHELIPDARFNWDVSKPLGQLTRSYDIDKIKSIGFTPKWSLSDGLRTTVEWYQNNPSLIRRYGA